MKIKTIGNLLDFIKENKIKRDIKIDGEDYGNFEFYDNVEIVYSEGVVTISINNENEGETDE